MTRPGNFVAFMLTAVLLLVPMAVVSGCSSRIVIKSQKRPAPRVEVKPARPGPKYVWVKGHWRGRPGHWTWVPGHWKVRR